MANDAAKGRRRPKRTLGEWRGWLRRIRALSIIMKRRDAIALVSQRPRSREYSFWLKPVGREITVRAGESDVACLEQVFIEQQYGLALSFGPAVIVDAGANIGAATLYFAKRFPAAQIFAIEPDTENFALLKRNCAGLSQVRCVEAALWSDNISLKLVDSEAEKWGLMVEPGDGERASIAGLTVPALMTRFAIDRIGLLKLDIEGAEREIFSSPCAREWLTRVDAVAIELHDWMKPGCAQAFYSAIQGREFIQEICGENVFVQFVDRDRAGLNRARVGEIRH